MTKDKESEMVDQAPVTGASSDDPSKDIPTPQDVPHDAYATSGQSTDKARRIVGELRAKRYPVFEEMKGGLPNYWYPAMKLTAVPKRRPKTVTLLGQRILVIREDDKIYAVADRCAHRGVPLSVGRRWEFMPGGGRREFPCTLACAYHGWTYDLRTGELVAALTDGPKSAIVRSRGVAIKTYPVEIRQGIVFIWVGDQEPVPLEEDVPENFLLEDNFIGTWFRVVDGNWRDAVENGSDIGHFYYLHRTAIGYMFSRNKYPLGMVPKRGFTSDDGKEIDFIVASPEEKSYDYPGLGQWPRPGGTVFGLGKALDHYGTRPEGQPMNTPLRRPGVLEVRTWPKPNLTHFEWYVPVDDDHYLYVQNLVYRSTSKVKGTLFKAWYWTWGRWLWHQIFNSQDFAMVAAVDSSNPEILFRPDASIRYLRKFFEADPRWKRTQDAMRVAPDEGGDANG